MIPHFDKYPLQSNKQNDFLKFKEICLLMQQEKHLTKAGLKKIIEISLDTNSKTRRQTTKEDLLLILANK